MVPSESTSKDAIERAGRRLNGVRAASTIVLLAGIWFFVSPWVYGVSTHSNAWNSWIVGAIMFLLGCIRVWRPAYSTALSWCNMVLAIWTFFSPWIYGYIGNEGRFINSLCIGVIVFVLSITSAKIANRVKTLPISHA